MSKIVLVVDDSSIARRTAKEVLEGEGYRVEEARNGQQGVDMCKLKQYSLVLSDYNMPGLNGVDMVRQIRPLPGYEHTPIFMVTTEFTRDLLTRGKNAGVTLWVVKPFDETKLRTAVRKLMAAA